MPRPQRPVDPAAGPLESFAHDLRMLREKAGNPTYRALARKAGYSATTLSEAAGGTRRPSLDVTLAYVGACDGDVDAWRARWHELPGAETPASETPAPAPPVAGPPVPAPETDGQVATAPPTAPPEPLPAPRAGADHRNRQRRFGWLSPPTVAAVAVLGVVAAVVLTVMALGPGRARHEVASAGRCPGTRGATFTGRTYLVTRVREGAALDQPVVRTVPAGCTVGFTGFCVGDSVYDAAGGVPDTRWFLLVDGGAMSSAVVHGNPPPTLRPSACPGGVPAPTRITLGVDRASAPHGMLRLYATGAHLQIAGFTMRDDSQPGSPRWHQIALAGRAAPTSPSVQAMWRWPTRGDLVIVAVACLGGDGPTDVVDAVAMRGAAPVSLSPVRLSAADRDAAALSACQYPSHG